MRRLEEEIKSKVIKASRTLDPDIRQKIKEAYQREEKEEARIVLKAILDDIEIAEKTNLSRPAVSHHMQILKDAGIVKARKEGTCIYYYLDPDADKLNGLISLFVSIRAFMANVPDRSGDE